MPGPPPPPPLPGMGRGGGPPAPPPPPPGGLPKKGVTKGAGRGALLSSIEGGARLKKVAQVNDRSAPIIDAKIAPAAPVGGAPPVPGMAKRPTQSSLAPPPAPNRARSNSDGGDGGGSNSGPPQLAGIFAGGIPKLRKAGGIDTGADNKSPYMSDPESSRSSAPRPPMGAAPKPPSGSAPRVPGSAPPRPPGSAPSAPSVMQLRNNLRPASSASLSSLDISSKPRPPPIGKKPPMPPPASRKPSGLAPTPSPIVSLTPSSVPPPPPASAPRPPPLRSTPPPPPSIPPSAPNGNTSLAEQAARNAFGRNSSTSPAAPPPPPPPGSALSPPSRRNDSDEEYDPYAYNKTPSRLPPAPSLAPPRPLISAPSVPPPPPTSPPSRTPTMNAPQRSMLDISSSSGGPQQALAAAMGFQNNRPSPTPLANSNASSYSLANGNPTPTQSTGQLPTGQLSHRGSTAGNGVPKIHDLRWRFQDDSSLPKPRECRGGAKRYRAGRVSSVPLDLSVYGS